MTIETVNVDDTDDLDAFEVEFFGTRETPEPAPSAPEEDNEDEIPGDTPATETEDDEDVPAEPEIDEDDVLKIKRRKTARERIDELTAKSKAAERERDALRKEFEEFRASLGKEKPATAPSLPTGAPDPNEVLEDGTLKYPLGEFDPTYISALTRFVINEEKEAAKKERELERHEELMKEAEEQLELQWTERVNSAVKDLPDLREKAVVLEDTFRDIDPNYGKFLASTIMSMELGPQVLYYLSDHLPEAHKIVNSGATEAILALGRLEARLASAAEKPEKPRQTQAATPPPQLRGSGGKFTVPDDTDDLEAFEKKFFN